MSNVSILDGPAASISLVCTVFIKRVAKVSRDGRETILGRTVLEEENKVVRRYGRGLFVCAKYMQNSE